MPIVGVRTGDAFLDKLLGNGITKNPAYNPKTKKGRLEPRYTVDNTPGSMSQGIITQTANRSHEIQWTGAEYGRTNESIEEDERLRIPFSRFNTEDELNKARAHNQSNWEKAGNALVQAGVGEAVLGTLKGFGDIAQGFATLVTGQGYEGNLWSNYFDDLKTQLDDHYKIYQEDPNASFNFGDFGWWASNAVSTATTLSLMIPAAGWARGISLLSKATRLDKLLGWGSRAAANGIARTIGALDTAGSATSKFGALRSIAGTAGRIENTINNGSKIAMTALLSRTGENFQEGKQVYDDVYKNSLENLNNMPDSEFAKFLRNNPEFVDGDTGRPMSKEDIAKQMATQSANQTFYNDYWMLAMDIPQFKALGSLWGKGLSRATTASERIAAQAARQRFAGVAEDKVIKDTIGNRIKETTRFALKNPKGSVAALELGEGFEEMFQGIQSNKGMDYATKYFDPSFTPRSISSQLADPSLWEQGFWGAIGGIAFQKVGSGANLVKDKVADGRAKKTMSADAYEQWKRGHAEAGVTQINDIGNKVNQFISDMKMISQGKNPYNYTKDPNTGEIIVKNGNVTNESIDEEQKDLLKGEAIDKFVTNVTLDSVDSGTYNLIHDVLGSQEFNKYIEDTGLNLSADDRRMADDVAARMDNIKGVYRTQLINANGVKGADNPFVVRSVARQATRNILAIQDLREQSAAIDRMITNANKTNDDYSTYTENQIYESAKQNIAYIDKKIEEVEKDFKDGNIGKSARDIHIDSLNRKKRAFVQFAARNSTDGAIDELRDLLSRESGETTGLVDDFNKFVDEYRKTILGDEQYDVPPSEIEDLITRKIKVNNYITLAEADAPTTSDDYAKMYDEFSEGMSKASINRIDNYADRVKNYLRSADNFDEAVRKVLDEDTGNRAVDKALHALKYGYTVANTDDPRFKGRSYANMTLATIIDGVERERKKTDEIVESAAKGGRTVPVVNNGEVDKGVAESERSDNGTPPSTGNQEGTTTATTTVAGTTGTTETATTTQTNDTQATLAAITPTEAPAPPVDTRGMEGAPAPEAAFSDQSAAEQEALNQQFATPSLQAEIVGTSYVVKLGIKSPALVENAIKDKKALDDLIDRVRQEIINKVGGNYKEADVYAKRSITQGIINLNTIKGEKSPFKNFVRFMAMGFAARNADTGLVLDEDPDSVAKSFLDEYAKLKEIEEDSVGDKVINVSKLFDYLLNTEGISYDTAKAIYINLNKFVAKGEKGFKFVGLNTKYTTQEFFNNLGIAKADKIKRLNQAHIYLVDPQLRDSKWMNAFDYAANGGTVYVSEQEDKHGQVTNLNISVKRGGRLRDVKLGILRAVQKSVDNNTIGPVTHHSGLRNIIHIDEKGVAHIEYEDLINSIINDEVKYKTFADLYLQLRTIYESYNSRLINNEQLVEGLNNLDFTNILEFNEVKELISSGMYLPRSVGADKKAIARELVSTIGGIIYSDYHDSNSDIGDTEDFSTSKLDAVDNLKNWTARIYNNFQKTYALQQAIKNSNAEIAVKLGVNKFTRVNQIANREDFVNVASQPFNPEGNPNSKYTPLVMVQDGELIDENGNKIGESFQDPNSNNVTIGNYSMGYIVSNGSIPYVAYLNTAIPVTNAKLIKDVKQAIGDILNEQLNNKDKSDSEHETTFNTIKQKMLELFGAKGIFRLGNNYGVMASSDGNAFTVFKSYRDANGTLQKQYVLDIHKYHINGEDGIAHRGNAISILDTDGTMKNFNSREGNPTIGKDTITNLVNQLIKDATTGMTINRSSIGFTGKDFYGGNRPVGFTKNSDEFVLNIGADNEYHFRNYGDFIHQTGGFTTNVRADRNGKFVTEIPSMRDVSIIGNIVKKDTIRKEQVDTSVSDLLFEGKNPKRKTVDVEEVLKAAGVSQEDIDILRGKDTGVPFINKYIVPISLDNGVTNARYNLKSKRIEVTAKGAKSMNGNPRNALRLIIHENVHRLFANKNGLDKERIIRDLNEIREYVSDLISNDNTLNESIRTQLTNLLDIVANKSNDEIRVEEFLAESLSQPYLIEYLNSRDWKEDVSIDGIPQKKKSIFQKLIDVLLNLIGIKGNVRKNSILAREYYILGKGTINTNDLFTNNTTTNSTPADINTEPEKETTPDKSSEVVANNSEQTSGEDANPTKDETPETADIDHSQSPVEGSDTVESSSTNDELSNESDDSIDDEDDLFNNADTDLVGDDSNITDANEIYAPLIADGINNDVYGVKLADNMNEFLDGFPSAYRASIRALLGSDGVNYHCS